MYKSWTKRFARKIWKSPLALAVTAGILAGAGFMPSAFAAEKVEGILSFNNVITGSQADTAEYAEPYGYTEYQQMGGVLSGTYIFNWDNTVNTVSLPGIHLDSQYKITDVTVKNGAELKIREGIRAYLHDTLSVSAKNTDITANDTEGIFADGSIITVNGNVNVKASGTKGKGLVAYLDSIKGIPGQSSGTYSDASLTINGTANVKSSGHAVQASGADINITGLANIHSTDGIAIRALAYRAWTSDTTNEQFSKEKMATVNIVGGNIVADKYDAIHNEGSNVYLNNEGTNTLTVKGNVVMLDRNGHTANTIMKLTDDKSSWTGGLFTTNYMIDNGTNMQLTLQNGGTWFNEGEDFKIVQGDESLSLFDYTRTVASLAGGTSTDKAGVIFQKTDRDLTINNYSGYTKVFYAHENDGTTISDYAGGDIIVNSAAKGSQIDIITDNHGINLNNAYQVNTVLNNLAQKLVYSGAIVAYDEETQEPLKAEDNLFGKAVIAEGLTNSSKYVTSNPISFDSETGRGYLGEYDSQLVTEFTTPLTGVVDNDTVYSNAYVLQETGEYKFTKDSSINVNGQDAKAIDLKEKATIIAGGTTLSLNVTDSSGLATGLNNEAVDTTIIRADKLNIAVSGTGGAAGINQTKGDITIDGNVNIDLKSTSKGWSDKVVGIYANKGTININGDLNAKLDTVTGTNIGNFYYGASGLYATTLMGPNTPKGADIVVDGKVTLSGNANGIFANMGGSTVTVGAADITIDKDKDATNRYHYAALRAEDGTVNVNVVLDENGKAINGANNDVNIKGNVVVGVGAMNGNDINYGQNSAINLALTNSNSSFQGVVDNQFGLAGQEHLGFTFYGDSNIWLQNGATWTNEQYGGLTAAHDSYAHQEYNGSLVSNFVGGDSIYTAGNIFQNDRNPLTIGNYRGVTNIFYAHTGDGTARENYAAGDTIVNHAAKGSSIYMLTDNSNITVENRAQVNKVLNALAGKLVYTGYINKNEDNLQGMVGIAEGLTSSSAVKVVKGITFSEEDGRGSYGNAESAAGTFKSAITGTDRDEDYLVAGVTRDYIDYRFDPLDYAGKTITILSDDKPGIMFSSGHDVYIDAPMLNLQVDGGIVATRDKENPWSGSYLNIYTTNDEGASGRVIINKASGNAIESTADVRIYGQAELKFVGNGLVAGLSGTNSGSIEITKGTTIQAENHGILADGGSVTLDSGYNNIVAKGDAIHAEAKEVNPEGTTYKTGGYVYVEGGHIESTSGNAVYSNGGTIYINVGGDKTTTMKGDVLAENGSEVSIKLTDADSYWTGRLDNQGSNVEITMKNGALWTNSDGEMHINSFTGGEDLESAAYIKRGAGDLTIDSFSGAANFFYAHSGDGDKVEDYAAYGDTIIKSAEAGSTVKLITNKNDKFDITNLDTYKDVLNALASKLVYSEYVSGARNLNGYVAIAEGLTSRSAELAVRSITFSNKDGRGSYIEVYEDGITGSDEGSRYDKNNVITTENGKVIYSFGSQSGVNMVIPSMKVQEIDKPLDVIVNSVETLDFKEKVYASADNNITINGKVNINNGWVNAIESAGGKVVLNNDLKIYTAAKGLVADTVVKTEAQDQLNRAGVIDINESVNITSYGESVFANGGTININQGGKFDTRYGDYPDAMTVTSDTIVAMDKVVTPYGDASEAKLYQGVVNINGDKDHSINIQSNTNALYSEGGIININQNKDAKVNMTGFISGHASENGTAPVFNVNLTNADSRWEGRIRVDDKAQVNLTLQNGATWATYRYYQADNNTPELYLNNRVHNFVGSTAGQDAGIIRMNDYIDLNLENYSGNTILYYDHLMDYDGSEKWHYENGVQKADVHVGSAAEGSVITVMTDNYGNKINLSNAEQVNKVLNTLASFLVYDGYVQGEQNLTGKVAIAEGLTAEYLLAALSKAEKMSFDEATGRGYYEGILPGVYKTAITGSSDAKEYADRGVLPYNDKTEKYTWSEYNFKEAYKGLVVVPSISLSGDATVNSDYAMQIDGGINVGWERNLTVNAPKVSMDTEQDAAIVANGGNIIINGAVDITGTGNGLEAFYAQNELNSRPSNLTVTRNVNITTKGIAVNANGGYITIDGVVDLESDDNAIVAKSVYKGYSSGNGGATIKGGVITSNEGYAIYNEGSQVTINDGSDTTTVVNGNIYQKYSDIGSIKAPVTNLKLTDADSAWNGSLETSGGNTFNLTLQNGAIWTDAIVESEAGNTIFNFTGGTTAGAEGRINRNDTRDLTINNYSGFTSIFYEHGADYTQFAAGNTIINSAAANSQITLITQRAGIDLDNDDIVKAALNALAGKLYYNGYVKGEDNLSGKLMIAEDLTGASSAIDIKDVEFNPNNGQGTFGQGPFIPDHQTDTAFTTAITGNREKDYVYAGVAKEDADNAAQYVFQKDSTITTTGAAINTSKNVNIDASGKALNVVVANNSIIQGVKNNGGTLDIKAKELNVNLNATPTSNTNNSIAGVQVTSDSAVTNITGNVNVVAKSTAGSKNVIYGLHTNNKGNALNIVGNVTMKGEDGSWGIDNGDSGYGMSDHMNKGTVGIFGEKGTILVNGNVDLKVNGNGVMAAWENGSRVDITGGGSIVVNKDIDQNVSGVTKGNYALITAGGGHITMNYADGKAGTQKVTIDGNIGMTWPNKWGGEANSIILAMTTADSVWNGVMHNSYYGTKRANEAEGTLYLQNGATWINEQWGPIVSAKGGATGAYTGSTWENFIGGTSSAKAGNIYQKDSKNINLVNYSGWTNVYYDHNVAEDGAISFVGGDTIITNAAAKSGITLLTDKNGVTGENLNDVLNSLANKLIYKAYISSEKNLTGKVGIVESLTTPTYFQQPKDISFDENTGKGYYTSASQGDDGYDKVERIDLSQYSTPKEFNYLNNTRFIETDKEAIKTNYSGLTINADNKIVEVNVESNNGANAVLFYNDDYEPLEQNINASDLNVNFKANTGTSAVVSAGRNVTSVNGNMKVIAENTANKILNGIYLYMLEDCPNFTIIGDLTMRDGENYGITNHNTAANGNSSNYSVTGILADGSYKYYKNFYNTSMTVGGKVDMLIDGTAVVATKGGIVNLNGGGSIRVNKESANGVYNYALETYQSTTNGGNIINFNADAADKDVTIKGNVGLFGGGSITIGLANAKSSWTGVMHDVNGTNKVTLKNGATWYNEKWGKTYDAAGVFKGSVIDTFVGGSTAETAGNIYQKDGNALTLSNYSGWTNVYYAHEDGAPTTMIGGNTVIGSAAAGSGITLLTQNNGVNADNVANVLNALAQKLTYSANDSKLTGKVAIAEGLTTGSAATGKITFGANGVGSYNAGNAGSAAMETSLNRGIMLAEENGSTEEGTVAPEAPTTTEEPKIVTNPLVAEGIERTVTDQVKIQLTEEGNAITAKGTESAPGEVAVLNDAFISAESGSLDNRTIYGNAVYAEGSTVALNPEGGKEIILKGDVVLKGTATQEAVAGSSAIIVLDTAKSSWQGNLYNDDASSAAVTLQNGAIWNNRDNRDNNREEALGITGHKVSNFTGGATAEAAGNFFQNNEKDMVFDQYSGYTKVFFGHLNDGSDAKDYTAGNLIINSAAAGSGITMITNQSYNIDVNDEEQVNKILNSLAGKLFYNGYAKGERNLTANVQIAESLTGSSKFLTGGVLNFNSNGQGYYGKQVHIAGIYTTDITGSAADSEFINAGVTENYKTYNFKDSVEGEGASKVILQGIKVAGDTGNHKDEKEVTINIITGQAELNDSINIGYRGTVDLKADTVTIKGVENTAIDNYGGTLVVGGNVEISDVANGIHTNSKAEVAGNEYIGTVDIKGQAKITAEKTAIATEGGVVSVGARSEIISTNGDAIVAQGQRLFSMQVGYYDKEVAGEVHVAGGTISAVKGNAINAAGGKVYVNEKGGYDTKITGNILVAKDTTTVGTQTEDTPKQSIVKVTLDTEKSSWKGSLSVAEDQVMNLTLQNGATWTDAVSELAGNTITRFVGGTSSDTAGTIVRNDTRDLTIDNYSGWTNIYYEHAEDDATKMIGGDTIIKKAVEGSGINMITGSKGVNTNDKEQVTAVLSALANKLVYEEAAAQKDEENGKTEENGAEAVMFAAANDDNSTANTFKLQAKAFISQGLTTSEKVASGTVNFKTAQDGQSFVTIDDVEISGGESGGDKHTPLDKVEIVTGGEPVTMRAIKSSMAAATMMWRSENNDLMKRMGDLRVLEGERGLWAKYYTGKQEMDAQDTNFSEKYKAYQIGYDTKVNENWTVGAALSYNDGTSSTSNVANGATGAWANGHGEQKNISLGVYGSWKAKDGQYADIIMKASRLNNEYNLKFHNGIGTYDIDGDYKTWGTSISAEYGKRFEGDKGTYFEPSAELTYGHMAGKSYSAATNYYGSTMYMDQDGFDTLVGRIGLRVGQKLEQGSYFAKLALAHEFMGDYDTRYNVDGADHNSTHLDFGDTWYELQIGGTAKLSANSMLYADFQRSFGGDVTEKWRVDAGLRFTF